MLGVLVLYGLLQNPYWVPAGDSEVYISIARSLATTGHYEFNGQPVAMVPPGWPAVLAAVMKVAPWFLALKLVAMACMAGAMACSYWIVRRFTGPTTAAIVILTTASISHVYQGTFWLISESLFCLVSSAALLLALEINENRGGLLRIALLALLCAAAVTVRWAGVLGLGLVAAALVHGQLIPRLNRQWLAILLCTASTVTAFRVLRQVQQVTPAQAAAVKAFGGAGEEAAMPPPPPTTTLADKQVSSSYELITGTIGTGGGYGARIIGWGRWFGWFYWQPLRAGASSAFVGTVANLVGWVMITVLLVTALAGAMRRQWLWPALLGYCGVLALNWPLPNSRYFVPIGFLLTLGVLLAAKHLEALAKSARWNPRLPRMAAGLFVGATLLCNLALWAIDVRVAHADDFYVSYEAGLNQSLIASARHLSTLDLGDAEIAVTPSYVNLGRKRLSPFSLRATTMLTGKAVVSLPKKWHVAPGPRLARWLHRNNIRYYLHQNPISPWRVWHFRMAWLQRRMTGAEPEVLNSGWQLYRIEAPDHMAPVEVPPSRGWPTRVPGL